MPEVYRVLFVVFGLDPEAEDCQPKLRRQLDDIDYVSVEFDNRKLSWQDVAAYKDLVMAERLLMKHIDAPGKWLQEKHRCFLVNKFCGKFLRRSIFTVSSSTAIRSRTRMSTTVGSEIQLLPQFSKLSMASRTLFMGNQTLGNSCLRLSTLSRYSQRPYEQDRHGLNFEQDYLNL